MYLIIIQRLLLEALADILFFPVWWYSGGVKYISIKSWHLFLQGNERLSPWLWLRNIFVPMYGQRDWEGKIVSFIMRLVQIILRGIALFFWLVVCLVLIIVWVIFPFVVIYGLFSSALSRGL